MSELRIVQRFIRINGEHKDTRYTLQQKIDGEWIDVPIRYQWEDDPDILERLKADPIPEDDE